MRGTMTRLISALLLTLVAGLTTATSSQARPLYFETLTDTYGIIEGDDLYACGVCHIRWLGTGQRNLYGQAVEQQLYVGRTIEESLALIEDEDSDGDGFSNVDELTSFLTLPGYNCENFVNAVGAPTGYDTFVTPGVATCLEPRDIRILPTSVGIFMRAGEVQTTSFTIFNNGSEEPLHIESVGFTAPPPGSVALLGPTPPYDIPVGDSVVYTIEFSAESTTFFNGTIEVVSDDPDPEQEVLEVAVNLVAIVVVLAPADQRAACFESMAKEFTRYSKTHFKEWGDCQLDELGGQICDGGGRDYQIARREARLLATIGGDRDEDCLGSDLTRVLLDYSASCGAPCDDLTVSNFPDIAECLICRQGAGMQDLLGVVAGSSPPALPSATIDDAGHLKCVEKVEKTAEKAISKLLKLYTECEIEGVANETTPDCPTTLAEARAKILAKVDKAIDGCSGFTDPDCPIGDCEAGSAAVDTIAQDLARALLGQADPE